MLVQDYWDMMYDKLNVLDEECLIALENIIRQKEKVAKHYNKKILEKIFLTWRFSFESYITH